nr:uncharacterized protein LOC103215750 isoform X1 [Chlorocebus sabaeus]
MKSRTPRVEVVVSAPRAGSALLQAVLTVRAGESGDGLQDGFTWPHGRELGRRTPDSRSCQPLKFQFHLRELLGGHMLISPPATSQPSTGMPSATRPLPSSMTSICGSLEGNSGPVHARQAQASLKDNQPPLPPLQTATSCWQDLFCIL